MFNLYYLIDQQGDVRGDKTLQGNSPFESLSAARAQAQADGVQHYSVEEIEEGGEIAIIVFIC